MKIKDDFLIISEDEKYLVFIPCIKDEQIKTALENNKLIEQLALLKCEYITKEAFKNFSNINTLRSIEFNSINQMEDSWLDELPFGLTKIYLFKCNQITSVGIKNILQKYPNLTQLFIQGCIGIKDKQINSLLKINDDILKGTSLKELRKILKVEIPSPQIRKDCITKLGSE